jgi:hypothetical protein
MAKVVKRLMGRVLVFIFISIVVLTESCFGNISGLFGTSFASFNLSRSLQRPHILISSGLSVDTSKGNVVDFPVLRSAKFPSGSFSFTDVTEQFLEPTLLATNVNCTFSPQDHAGKRPISIEQSFTSILSLGRFGQKVYNPIQIENTAENAAVIKDQNSKRVINESSPIPVSYRTAFWIALCLGLIQSIAIFFMIIIGRPAPSNSLSI